MDKLYGFSEHDIQLLKGIIQKVKSYPATPPKRYYSNDEEGVIYPETYIALTPSSGISALTYEDVSGTGNDGSVYPGYAECSIYMIDSPYGTPVLIPLFDRTKTVYNISTCPIPGNTYVPIIKEKYFNFLVINTDVCSDSTSTSSTTTSTTTPPPNLCSGSCLFTWDSTSKLWEVISVPGTGDDSCSTGCSCTYPVHCGTYNGETTRTVCGVGTSYVGTPPCCGQSTTTSTTSTPPDCSSFTCQYGYNQVLSYKYLIYNDCLSSSGCYCPDWIPTEACESSSVFNCVGTTTAPPISPYCTGSCLWTASPGMTWWQYVYDYNRCSTYLISPCACPYPSIAVPNAGMDCPVTVTYCVGPTDDECTSTTSQCPTCCDLNCHWIGSDTNPGGWTIFYSECGPSCACYNPPSYDSTSSTETGVTRCGYPTTTTTTTTVAPVKCWECYKFPNCSFVGSLSDFGPFGFCSDYDPTGTVVGGGGSYQCLWCTNPTGTYSTTYDCYASCSFTSTTTTTSTTTSSPTTLLPPP